MSGDISRRLQQTLPRIRNWIEQFVLEHSASSVSLGSLAGRQLRQCFSTDFLASTRVVALQEVKFPPVDDFGLPEFKSLASMTLAGITFDKTFYVQAGSESQSLYFHEAVHVVQWEYLGFDRFLLTYAAHMIDHAYRDNPLEAIAFSLQVRFETGLLRESPVLQIQEAAESAWSDVCRHFEL